MKILVLGTRGIPGIPGGVEEHCEHLYSNLAKMGCEIYLVTRKPYANIKIQHYKEIKLVHVNTIKQKNIETAFHTLWSILVCKKLNPDIIHFHAIGPSLFVPLAKLFGFKVVVTHHGPDYQRKKWGPCAKKALKIGERNSGKYADSIIVISEYIKNLMEKNYGIKTILIPNGVIIRERSKSSRNLKKYGLESGNFIISVGRFVPEKAFEYLIDAFIRLERDDLKLVIAGDADHESEYSKKIKKMAKKYPNIVLTGFINKAILNDLYSHAKIFVLPSFYEGLPLVLLEAMSFGLSCVISDIHGNRNVGLDESRYFRPGDVESLYYALSHFIDRPFSENDKKKQIVMVDEKYNWKKIALRTMAVYSACLNQ